MNRKVTGQRIKSIRLSLGKNKREFGELFNPMADNSNVSRWESGKSIPNNKRLKRIAELGELSVDELLAEPFSKCSRCNYEEVKSDYKFCPICGQKVEV